VPSSQRRTKGVNFEKAKINIYPNRMFSCTIPLVILNNECPSLLSKISGFDSKPNNFSVISNEIQYVIHDCAKKTGVNIDNLVFIYYILNS
jgi:hypothetical protein